MRLRVPADVLVELLDGQFRAGALAGFGRGNDGFRFKPQTMTS